MVGRRFWPHGGWDSACALLNQAVELRRRGMHVEVLTPKYETIWPDRTSIREITVHRGCLAAKREWSMGKYIRGMTAWVASHSESFDLIYVDSCREELIAAIEGSDSSGAPVLARCNSSGTQSDLAWWETSRHGKRCWSAAKRARGIILQDAASHRDLVIRGLKSTRFFRIPPGVHQAASVTPSEQWALRQQLAMANSDLATEPDTPVLLCHATMSEASGLEHLVRVSRLLLLRFPNLRIWLLGDGPSRDAIYSNLRSEGVRASVAMPGSFSDPQDVFKAANLYFQAGDEGFSYFLPLAVSLQLPIVAVDQPSIRSAFAATCDDPSAVSDQNTEAGLSNLHGQVQECERGVHWCDSDRPKSVKETIVGVLTHLPDAVRDAEKLRDQLLRRRSSHQCLDAFISAVRCLTFDRV